METLLIVDGSNLLFQMFYGMPARIPGSLGQSVHGTLGFLGALLKILRMVRIDRPFLPQIDFQAILNACRIFTASPPPVPDPQ